MKAIQTFIGGEIPDPPNQENNSEEETINKLCIAAELMIFSCMAIGVTGVALYDLKILKQMIKEDKENYMMYLVFKWLLGEEEKKKKKENLMEKIGQFVRITGDLLTIIGAFALWASEARVVSKECVSWIVPAGAIISLWGDIMHDKKISIYDVATATYAGVFLATAIFKIR